MRQRYDKDRWLGQDFYPVLIAEKDTLAPVLQPVAQAWQMPFTSSRGYASLKLQHDVAETLCPRYDVGGQPALVRFVSDLDRAGLTCSAPGKRHSRTSPSPTKSCASG
jgi:hypothetical protein